MNLKATNDTTPPDRYCVVHWWGEEESDVAPERFPEILRSVSEADAEHPDTWLKHESEWALSYFHSGRLIYENVEGRQEPRHMLGISVAEAAKLWALLAKGQLDAIEREPWLPGYG